MIPITHSIVIERPPTEVFNFVTDFRNDTQWWKPVIHTEKITAGEIGGGSEFIQHAKVLFVGVKNHLQVLEWNPPYSVKYRNESAQLPYDLFYQFAPVNDGTLFSLEASLEMKGVLHLISPITTRALKSQLNRYFGILKQVMETEQAIPIVA